ncbi:hypothetical protein KDH_65900 [Dictyobacter sp. S3.2.2.5]|uniref:DUF3995 domain-containing protein n=1 Tax=Dictyobacter halimunensis TaxID=3026934 RepID=A0ABQ6FZR8_9CHLR|nr:hypothetical protein KDH_65900 [Dictyobacter sp. S3.2.2.5]
MVKTWSQPSDSEEQNRTVWAGYASLGWVIIFLGFHVYWAFGGRFGLGDAIAPLPAFPHSVGAWLFTIIVFAMFVLGIIVPLAIVQSWGPGLPRWMLLIACWIGSIVLIVRAVASMIDDFSRLTGILPNGLTGMTYAQITGDSQISAYTLWSGRGIDVYFLLGGILYGIAAWNYAQQKRRTKRFSLDL